MAKWEYFYNDNRKEKKDNKHVKNEVDKTSDALIKKYTGCENRQMCW